jgi:hypothetical protein
MKNLVTILAVVTALTTMIYARPVLAAGGNWESPEKYGTFAYENSLETGSLPAMGMQNSDSAPQSKTDEKAPTINVGGETFRIGIDTP